MDLGIRPERVARLAVLEGLGLGRRPATDAPLRYAEWLDELRDPPRFRPYASFDEVAARLRSTNPRLTTEKAASGDLLVAVRDSGPGLAPGSLENLFKAFHTTKPNGLGLGLSICRSIIEAYGGRLWASANAPRGAVFQFTLPSNSTVASPP